MKIRSALAFMGRHARQAGWTGLDQLLSSTSNVIVSLAVARSGGTEVLGQYAVAFSVYLVILSFQRQLVSEPFLSQSPSAAGRRQERSSLTIVVAGLLGLTAIVWLVGRLFTLDYIEALAFTTLPLGLHDQLRYIAFRRKTPETAAFIDALWVFSLLLAWPLLIRSDAAMAVLIWGAAAAFAASAGLLVEKVLPSSLSQAIEWWKQDASELGGYFALAAVAHTVGTHLTMIGLAAIIGVSAVGELRAVQILLAPATLLQLAGGLALIPRLADHPDRLTGPNARRLAVGAAIVASVIAVAVTALRVPLATLLFGLDVTPQRSSVVLWGLVTVFLVIAWAYAVMLRAERRGRPIALSYMAAFGLGTITIFVLATLGGLTGALIGYLVQAAILGQLLRRAWVASHR